MSAIFATLAAGTIIAAAPPVGTIGVPGCAGAPPAMAAPGPAAPLIAAAPRGAGRRMPARPTPRPTPTPAAVPSPAPAEPGVVQPAASPAAVLPSTVFGVVLDAVSGQPLAGVLVQQEGAVTSAFTQADGSFRLLLERGGAQRLTISAVGYEPMSVAVGDGKDLRVRIGAISGFVPTSPMLPTAVIGQAAIDTVPLNSSLIFAYRLRQQAVSAGAGRYEGLVSNDYRLGMRFRLRPVLIDAEGAHYESPIDVAGLDRASNPAFRPSTWQAGARLGLLTPVFHPDLELAAQGGYRWSNTVPNNADVPYTGSDLDWEQTRHAFGPVATLAWRPWRGRLHLEASYGYYPWVRGTSEAPGKPFADQLLTDLRGAVGVEIVPGMRLGLGYQAEHWSGNGDDISRMLSLQVHYTPGGVPKGLEP